MGELNGKVAFLTGGGRGVGVGIAMALARAGAAVALMGRTRDALDGTAAMIAGIGGRALVCVGDVGNREDVNAAVARCEAELGPVWALVNNAYYSEKCQIEDVTDAILDDALRTCVHGSLYTMQACFPAMKQHGGRIINFGSGAATMGLPEMGAYNIAKEAIRGLTKTAAKAWGRYTITVNTVCPLAPSDAFTYWFEQILDDAGRQAHLDGIPMRRMGDPEKDIGATVVFLAGPGGGFITARTLHVDGGNCPYDM